MELFKQLRSKDDQFSGGFKRMQRSGKLSEEEKQENIRRFNEREKQQQEIKEKLIDQELQKIEKEGFNKKITIAYRDNPCFRENIGDFIKTLESFGAQVNKLVIPEYEKDINKIGEILLQHVTEINNAEVFLSDHTINSVIITEDVTGEVFKPNFKHSLDGSIKFSEHATKRFFEKLVGQENAEKNIENYRKAFCRLFTLHRESLGGPNSVIIGVDSLFDHDSNLKNILKQEFQNKTGLIYPDKDSHFGLSINPEENEQKGATKQDAERITQFMQFSADWFKNILIESGVSREKISIVDRVFDHFLIKKAPEVLKEEKDFSKMCREKFEELEKSNLEPLIKNNIRNELNKKSEEIEEKMKRVFSDMFTPQDWIVCDGHNVRPHINEVEIINPVVILTDFQEEASNILKGTYPLKDKDLYELKNDTDLRKEIAQISLQYKKQTESRNQ